MGIARLVIALGLLVGVGIFGISAINDLMDGLDAAQTATPVAGAPANGWGPHDPAFDPPASTRDGVPGLASETHTPIDRDPGQLAPPDNATRSTAMLIRERDGGYTELAQYRVNYAEVAEVISHYQRVATAAGFAPVTAGPIGGGGQNISLSRAGQTLIVRAWPVDASQLPPARPPLRASSVSVNISLRYPITQPPADAPR